MQAGRGGGERDGAASGQTRGRTDGKLVGGGERGERSGGGGCC